MKTYFSLVAILISQFAFSQSDSLKVEQLFKELAENACKCIDSVSLSNKTKTQIDEEVHKCIDDQSSAYHLGAKLMSIDLSKADAEEKDGKKQINISINMNKDSDEYKEYYYAMERHLMENCSSIKEKIAENVRSSSKSVSTNKEARQLYTKGQDESKKGDFKKAISYYEAAVKIDPEFAFAWDNIGLCYRKLENYDKAIESYKRSLQIDPLGTMPLQNIAIAYQYKKEYRKAIEAYEQLAKIDKNNPEVFYGIGQVYTFYLSDLEKGLSNMCKAYNLYIEQKSPYRADAEKIINIIFKEMKKDGKEKRFDEILKENNIRTN